ncbi:Holliday junction resolvase RuvX [soil metagenome]
MAKRIRRTCALDLGYVRVGVAIDDDLRMYAHPKGVLAARPRPELFRALADLVRDQDVGRFIIGLPLDMSGGEGEAARKARILAQEIADATGCAVELWDERLTTVQARRALTASEVPGRSRGKSKRTIKHRIDEASAVTILEAWLDAQRKGDHGDA